MASFAVQKSLSLIWSRLIFFFFIFITLGGGSKKDLAVIYVQEEMDKEDVVHIYNGIFLSPKKEQNGAFAEMWMDPEVIIQNDVSQKEKNKYHII